MNEPRPTDDAALAEEIRVLEDLGMQSPRVAQGIAFLRELQRHRAAIAADKERVRETVRSAIDHSRHLPHGQAEVAIANRVADQLATPSLCFPPSHPTTLGDVWVGETKPAFTASAPKLTEEERNHLLTIRSHLNERHGAHASAGLWSAELATLDHLLEGK